MNAIPAAAAPGIWREVFFSVFPFLLVGLLLLGGIILTVVIVLALIRAFRKKNQSQLPPQPATTSTVVLPQRQCPQCGAELKPDAPEGLCPACLLQRGIATEGGAPSGTPPFTPPPLAELAKLFPQLEILEPIGQGGMGAVYKARQPTLDRIVALKILAPRSGGDVDFAERFTREARALAKLSHPNIVGVYDFGVVARASRPLNSQEQHTGETPVPLHYFIMEFVDGLNLRQIEQAGKLSPREALQIIPQICAALQFAHDEGIVHRDIKPENILLDKRGRVKIADFGLAKILGQGAKDFRLTGARDVMGTPHYMAPEQVEKPLAVDHRADIYSLGVVFYEMLTGELPLGKFAPPSQKIQVDVRLDEIVLRSLEKEPARRYQHASEVGTDVETVATASVNPTPNQNKNKTMNAKNQKSLWIGLAIAGACAVIGLATWSFATHLGSKPTMTSTTSANPNSAAEKSAMPAIQAWLKLMDNGDYAQSWETAADSFHDAVTKADWVAKSKEIRQPLGKVLSRKLISTKQPTTLPGFPEGSYLVAKFDTAFANLNPATETATFGLADDGQWKAIAYLILPGTDSDTTMLADTNRQAALSAVQAWLNLMDNGDYGQSWETAADSFHDAVTKADWVAKSKEIRQPLGKILSRKLSSAEQTSTLPGMPNGSYFVAKFDTAFANLKPATETVSFALAEDGRWKAIGYLIRPGANENKPAIASEDEAAVSAAKKWLTTIDDGHYAESWTSTSDYFQSAITQDKWVSALTAVREPLGDLISRKLISAQQMTKMPGAPDGQYVVMQFETSFANKESAIETVTVGPKQDGQWKASGYYIK
jgi:serine/threonine protein kinase